MPFFDCHLHTTLKYFLSNRKKSLWDALPGISILQSQSSLSQVKAGDVKLAVCAIFPLEKPMSSAVLLQLFGPSLTPIDKNRLNDINNSQYFDLIWDELKTLESADRQQEFKILRSMSDYDPGKINMLFSLEGGHSLYGGGSIVENLRTIKNHPKYRFVAINLTHLTQQEDICTHAFGMKLLKKNDEFKPNGFGIGEDGNRIIEAAYDTSSGPRILIDLKHMSLLSRKQFYAHPSVQGHPILASHIGVTGISYKDIHKIINGACVVDREFVEVKYDRVKGIGDTHFNPWSINLYDEEIKIIVASGGLMGLNLDQRIQGADNPKGEYWSLKEFRHTIDTRSLQIKLTNFELPDEPSVAPVAKERGLVLNVKKHLRHFANTILHIVEVGGPAAWDCMCIGSDFDGMINPLNCCQSARDFPAFREGLIEALPEMIAKSKKNHPRLNYHEGDIVEKVDKICFGNGFRFWSENLA